MATSPNTLVTPTQVAAVAAELAAQSLTVAGTLSRSYESEFGGRIGSSVQVRIPAAFQSRYRAINSTDDLATDNVDEQFVEVKLTDHAYSRAALTSAEMSLDIQNFSAQVVKPQVGSITRRIENLAIATLKAAPADTTITYSATDPAATFSAARRVLRSRGIDASVPLYAAVSADVYEDVQNANAFDTNQSGATVDLGNASGIIRGFRVFEVPSLSDGEIVFYVAAAAHLAVRAPEAPLGVESASSTTSENGFAIRNVMSFDSVKAQSVSLVDTFVGVQALDLPVDSAGTVDLVPFGGVVHVLAA
ncbi:hypothetical protein A0130_03190 [Leifsonia xyli]|uniref:hypothetical protein n=1 Tax=Leifsonia xyli TaxID=1575 RepID=UPI0007CDDC5B|nr:hypothetical protein A0130_03190 [Leifsonia xyli]